MDNIIIYGVICPQELSKYHYVYRITNKVLKKHYYGVRSSKNQPFNDLGSRYFSSSRDEDFLLDQKNNPQNYKYKVVKIFETRYEANEFEIHLHNKFNVDVNPAFYNKAKSTSTGWCTEGSAPAINPVTMESLGRISKDDPRWETGEIVHISTNVSQAKLTSTGERLGFVSCDDPRWETGEICGPTKGKKNAFCTKTGNFIGSIRLDDPRWGTGELITQTENFILITNGIEQRRYIPDGSDIVPDGLKIEKLKANKSVKLLNIYCAVSGNLKFSNIISVPFCRRNNYPQDRISKASKEFNELRVFNIVDDVIPVYVDDFNGSRLQVENLVECYNPHKQALVGLVYMDDDRLNNGTFVTSKPKLSVAFLREDGSSIGKVPSNDPRWETGEIVGHNHPLIWISNGLDQRHYIPDGTDSIPEGWYISKARLNSKTKLINIYDSTTGEILYENVISALFCEKFKYNQANISKCARDNLKGDMGIYTYRGLIVRYSIIDKKFASNSFEY